MACAKFKEPTVDGRVVSEQFGVVDFATHRYLERWKWSTLNC
jgi:hypothetical protein